MLFVVLSVYIFLVLFEANPNIKKGEKKVKIDVLCFSYTVKNIRKFYGKITGNQLPVHFPLFFTGARKHFQESGTER